MGVALIGLASRQLGAMLSVCTQYSERVTPPPPPPPRRKPGKKADPTRVSKNCADGKHLLCHGTVYLWPPEPGRRFITCECPVKNCGHGRRDR